MVTQLKWVPFVLTALLSIVPATSGLAQRTGRGGGGFGSFGSSPSELLAREDVRKELELVDEQVRKLEDLAEKRREGMRSMFSDLQGLSREERMERFRELFDKARADHKAEIDKILLPHQSKRLDQLSLQMRLRGGTVRALADDQMAEQLGITAEQGEKIRVKSEELEQEIRRKIAEIRKQAQEELLQLLTPKQREKWKDMVGDPFEFQRIDFGHGRGGRRGDEGDEPEEDC